MVVPTEPLEWDALERYGQQEVDVMQEMEPSAEVSALEHAETSLLPGQFVRSGCASKFPWSQWYPVY